MKILKKLWSFSVKSGLSLFIFTIMFITSVILVSITQKGKINYGNRCISSFNEQVLSYLNQEEIISYDYDFKCNTLYLDLTLNEGITKEGAKVLLIRLSSYYDEINYNVDTQITLKGDNYLILATLVNKEITINITTL